MSRIWKTSVALEKDGIEILGYRTTLQISGSLKRFRDYDWETQINSLHLVEVEMPKRKGARIKTYALNSDHLRINVGYIESYPREIDFTKAVIGGLKLDYKYYTNGDKKSLLKPAQEIYLLKNPEILAGMEDEEEIKPGQLRIRATPDEHNTFRTCVITLGIVLSFMLLIFIAC